MQLRLKQAATATCWSRHLSISCERPQVFINRFYLYNSTCAKLQTESSCLPYCLQLASSQNQSIRSDFENGSLYLQSLRVQHLKTMQYSEWRWCPIFLVKWFQWVKLLRKSKHMAFSVLSFNMSFWKGKQLIGCWVWLLLSISKTVCPCITFTWAHMALAALLLPSTRYCHQLVNLLCKIMDLPRMSDHVISILSSWGTTSKCPVLVQVFMW